MKGHIFKNLYLIKSNLITIGVMQLVVSGVLILVSFFGQNPITGYDEGMIFTTAALCYYLSYFIASNASSDMFKVDERPGWVSFSATTPSSARGQVLSKYYCKLIIFSGVTFICFITDLAVSIILPGYSGLSLLPILFSVEIFLEAIQIPFYIRFGSDKGLSIKGAAIDILILILLVYFLFGDISFLLGEDDGFAEFTKWLGSELPSFIISLIPYVSLTLYYISYRIGLKVYRKGAENYGE